MVNALIYKIIIYQKRKKIKRLEHRRKMATFMDNIKAKASALNKRIVLCEGEDSRVVKAAADTVRQKIAKITLLGVEEEIRKANPDVDLTGVDIVDPAKSEKRKEYAALLYDLRKSKGMTEEEAEKLSYDNTYFGVLMLKAGDVDGLVSGACHSTANTLRPGLQIVKAAPGVPLVSSYFLMVAPRAATNTARTARSYILTAVLTKTPRRNNSRRSRSYPQRPPSGSRAGAARRDALLLHERQRETRRYRQSDDGARAREGKGSLFEYRRRVAT